MGWNRPVSTVHRCELEIHLRYACDGHTLRLRGIHSGGAVTARARAELAAVRRARRIPCAGVTPPG